MSKHTVFISSLLTLSSGCTRVYPDNSAESASAGASGESGGIIIGTTTAMATSQGSSTPTTTHTGSASTDNISTSDNLTSTSSTTTIQTPGTTLNESTSNNVTATSSNDSTDTDVATAICHNGIVEPNEQCDDNNDLNNDECVDECVIATCGDGHIQINVETCDPGSRNDEIECRIDCSYCGDGKLNIEYEECDDGPDNGINHVCSTECIQVGLRAFITANEVTSNLGGISGANSKCAELAGEFDQKPTKDYRAWLSQKVNGTVTEPATSFIKECKYPIISTTNNEIAKNFDLLFSEGPSIPINSDEYGATQDSPVWTRTSSQGKILDVPTISDCGNWAHQWNIGEDASTSLTITGTATPQPNTLHIHWTNIAVQTCDTTDTRLYCFEQCPPP